MIEIRIDDGVYNLIIWFDDIHGIICKLPIKAIQELKSKLDIANEYSKISIKSNSVNTDLNLENKELRNKLDKIIREYEDLKLSNKELRSKLENQEIHLKQYTNQDELINLNRDTLYTKFMKILKKLLINR